MASKIFLRNEAAEKAVHSPKWLPEVVGEGRPRTTDPTSLR